MKNEFLDKERTFLRTRAISEAMRQICTRRLRTDHKVFDILIMICTKKVVAKKRILKIAHLKAELSNKCSRYLFLSYIKSPGV